MEYFTPSSPGGPRSYDKPAPVPVNPSTVPGGRAVPVPPVPPDWRPKNMPSAPVVPEIPMPSDMGFPPGEETLPFESAVPPENRSVRYAEPVPPPEENCQPDAEPSALFEADGLSLLGVPPAGMNAAPCFAAFAAHEKAMLSPPPYETSDMQMAPMYSSGFLHSQIGRLVRVEVSAGQALTERTGRLIQVGADYILLQNAEGHTVVCNLDAVRFATVVLEY